MNLRQLDRKYLGRESKVEDLQIARTKGAFVYDARVKRYIDFLSGWCVGNFGWDNTAITKAPPRRRPDYVYPEYLYRRRAARTILPDQQRHRLRRFGFQRSERHLDILEKSLL